MAEKLDLTTPLVEAVRAALTAQTSELLPYGIDFEVGVDPVTRSYQDTGSFIEAKCLGAQGVRQRVALANPGAAARALINQLNTANLSATSLLKRVLQRLQVLDAVKYAGKISGSPDR